MPPLKRKTVRDKLLKTAKKLFASKNYSAVTIREIGNVADSNSACISYYFGDKLGLYKELLLELLKDIRKQMEVIEKLKLSPKENLLAHHRSMMRNQQEDNESYRIIYKAIIDETDKKILRFVEHNYIKPLVESVAEIIEHCELKEEISYLKKQDLIYFIIGIPGYWNMFMGGFNSFFKGTQQENTQRMSDIFSHWLENILE